MLNWSAGKRFAFSFTYFLWIKLPVFFLPAILPWPGQAADLSTIIPDSELSVIGKSNKTVILDYKDSAMDNLRTFETINDYNAFNNNETLHPQVSVVDLSKASPR